MSGVVTTSLTALNSNLKKLADEPSQHKQLLVNMTKRPISRISKRKDSCCVCLKASILLCSLEETDADIDKWSSKLSYCIPEVVCTKRALELLERTMMICRNGLTTI